MEKFVIENHLTTRTHHQYTTMFVNLRK